MWMTVLLRRIGVWPAVPAYDSEEAARMREADQQRFERIMQELTRERSTYEVKDERPRNNLSL